MTVVVIVVKFHIVLNNLIPIHKTNDANRLFKNNEPPGRNLSYTAMVLLEGTVSSCLFTLFLNKK